MMQKRDQTTAALAEWTGQAVGSFKLGGVSYLILEGAPKDGPKVKLMTREPGQELDTAATARLET